jgi:hypothetical protein
VNATDGRATRRATRARQIFPLIPESPSKIRNDELAPDPQDPL